MQEGDKECFSRAGFKAPAARGHTTHQRPSPGPVQGLQSRKGWSSTLTQSKCQLALILPLGVAKRYRRKVEVVVCALMRTLAILLPLLFLLSESFNSRSPGIAGVRMRMAPVPVLASDSSPTGSTHPGHGVPPLGWLVRGKPKTHFLGITLCAS